MSQGVIPESGSQRGQWARRTGGKDSRRREHHGRGMEARGGVHVSQKLARTLWPGTPTNQSQQGKDVIRQRFLKTPLLAALWGENWMGSKGKETILESNYTQSLEFKCLVHHTVSNLAE